MKQNTSDVTTNDKLAALDSGWEDINAKRQAIQHMSIKGTLSKFGIDIDWDAQHKLLKEELEERKSASELSAETQAINYDSDGKPHIDSYAMFVNHFGAQQSWKIGSNLCPEIVSATNATSLTVTDPRHIPHPVAVTKENLIPQFNQLETLRQLTHANARISELEMQLDLAQTDCRILSSMLEPKSKATQTEGVSYSIGNVIEYNATEIRMVNEMEICMVKETPEQAYERAMKGI